MRFLTLILMALSFVAPASASDHRSEISKKLTDITGQGLNPDTRMGRSFSLPPGITDVASLTERDAVAIALWNSPGLEATLTELELGRADLVEAGVLINPSFDVLFGIGVKPWEFLLQMPIQALWQRPRRVSAAKLNLEMISEGLVQSGLDLVRDTRIAHAELATAQRRAELNSDAAGLMSEIADLTEKRLHAGDASELETRLVRLSAINAATLSEQSKRDLELAKERLRTLLGAPDHFATLTAVPEVLPGDVPPDEDRLVEVALSSRPDLRAAELGVQATGERAGWERSRVFDLLAIQLSSKEIGDFGFKTGPGLSVEIPLFDRNQGGISRAEAQLRQAMLRYLELAVQVKSEVRASRIRLVHAKTELSLLRTELLPILRETLALAKKAYTNGNISYLDLQLAQQPLLDALRSEETAMLDFRRAKAELQRAVGREL